MNSSSVPEFAPDELTKRYHVVAKLGEGGMALVHLAVVRGLGGVRKLVVLKSVRPQLVRDTDVREMFLAEARLAATLNHPNIVQTYEVAVIKGRPVIVMEYLDGQPLSRIFDRAHRAQVPLSFKLFVIQETLIGLEYVHRVTDLDGSPLHLVHRDVSPHNIFVTYDGNVKLLDFGIAKTLVSSGHTETGVIKGKIRYMSPEQLIGSVSLDPRADIFAVGVMLWEALTGQRMWEGLGDVMVMQSLISGRIPPPSSVAENVPPQLQAVCIRALSPKCEDRFESAAAMYSDLERAIAELGFRTSGREVGRFVADTFRELRSSTRERLEVQLKDEKATPVTLLVSDAHELMIEEFDDGFPGIVSSKSDERSSSKRRQKHGRRTAGVALAAVGCGVAVAAALGWLRTSRWHGGAREPAPQASASSMHDPAPERVVPDPGFQEVRSAESVASPIASAPTDPPPPKTERAGAASARKTHAANTQMPVVRPSVPRAASTFPQEGLSCTPPFYFDENRIKHVKPECL